jgi:hypothetical protein
VALGWGEPLRPWWGRPGFAGVPTWRGWAGPRVAATAVAYQHAQRPRAVVAVSEKQFGGAVRGALLSAAVPQELRPIRDAHPVRPGPLSLAPVQGAAIRPPARVASRPVVATRAPRETALPFKREPAPKPAVSAPAPRVVAPPKRADASAPSPRPSFGEKGTERARPAQPPRLEDLRRAPRAAPPAAGAKQAPAEKARKLRTLPGKPASGVFAPSARTQRKER